MLSSDTRTGERIARIQMPELFISYTRKDSASVGAVVDCLKRRGVAVWFDQYSVAAPQNIVRETNLALERCSHFLVFASRDYFTSEWTKAESNAALYAVHSKKAVSIVVVKLDDVSLPPLLASLCYLSFTTSAEVCDKIVDLLHLEEEARGETQPRPRTSVQCSWDSVEDSIHTVLIETLFSKIGSLWQHPGPQATFSVEINERLSFDLTLSVPLISNEVLMADVESEWRIYKILKKTVNKHTQILKTGGLGINEPAHEITLDEKLAQLNASRQIINSQLTAIVPVITRHEFSSTG